MIKTVIIEDEYYSSELLKEMLQTYFKEINLVGNASKVSSGIELIKEEEPELVFLDIHISEGNGFDILDAFNPIKFNVVFVTGFGEYALKAIKYAALDYLLKPVIIDELRLSIKKALQRPPTPKEHFHFLKEKLSHTNDSINQIILSDYKDHNITNLEDILYIEAQRSYVVFHLKNNQSRITSNALNYYEELLPSNKFFRIHKSYIINCEHIILLEKGRGGIVKLVSGQELPIAIRRKASFLRFMNNKGV